MDIALVGWTVRSVIQAGHDAARAWAVVPHVYRRSAYGRTEDGGWILQKRRAFRLREVLRLKATVALRVFAESLKLRLARHVVITRYPEEGLLANLLHVLEIVHRVRNDATVQVDWTLTGKESGFRYGAVGEDIWAGLFRTWPCPASGIGYQAHRRCDLAFWGTGKDHLAGRTLQRHRQVYHSTLLKWVEINNRRVLGEVERIGAQSLDGRYCIGIHRRVGNALVNDLQSDGKAPTLESFIKRIETIATILTGEDTPDFVIFLATDDADAVDGLREAFGSKLIVREGVQRTTADAAEVHCREWGSLSISDAEDVLIDTILLSQCNVLVHASSSVSTVASIMNPDLILIRA